jgi:hypothetical protein
MLLTAVLLAGCAVAPPPPAGEADALLTYLARVAQLPADAQRAELAQSARVFARDAGDYNRVRLGGLHAAVRAPLRDDARAIELLAPLAAAGNGTPPPLAAIAVLLSRQAAERQRGAREGARRQDQLRRQLDALREAERANLDRELRVQERTR